MVGIVPTFFIMMRFNIYKVKAGKLDTLRAWAAELEVRRGEALETMKHERVIYETFVIFKAGEDWYAVGAQEFYEERRAADMSVELNRRHFAILEECLETVSDKETLYQFRSEEK